MSDLQAGRAQRVHETERFLHEQIPLCQAMGVRVESFNEGRLVLTAPLEPNHNHLGTAFGGSLSALATLAGYALLWLQMEDRQCHIVIRDSRIRYRHPVTGALRASCCLPAEAEFVAFRDALRQHGRAKLMLRVTIEEGGRSCVEFDGEYVVIR